MDHLSIDEETPMSECSSQAGNINGDNNVNIIDVINLVNMVLFSDSPSIVSNIRPMRKVSLLFTKVHL